MKISVIGTGYVGLVTGVCLSEIGHFVTCIDIDEKKVNMMKQGISPIYEPGLEDLMKKNIKDGRLNFSSDHKSSFVNSDVIYIAVGTPQKMSGAADLSYIEEAAKSIAYHITSDTVVVTKSTVPVGTNDYIKDIIINNLSNDVKVSIVSNPEFLREGSAVNDTFNGDRIVIGTDNKYVADFMEDIYKNLNIPVFKTDIRSAEMIKYASNAFLATKISFINEIANICEKVGADIEDIAIGMGQDKRIGKDFLKAGIGYGGSCFPKDTNALVQIAGNNEHNFELLKSVIKVNNNQQKTLVNRLVNRFAELKGKRIAILGIAFKPNTDDIREAASIVIINELAKLGADIIAYDPIAIENAKKILPKEISYASSVNDALSDADAALILTEWEEIKEINLLKLSNTMKEPILFDGRNCFSLEEVRVSNVEYHSIGRPSLERKLAAL
ncbi:MULTISPECIES: UDP-glucose dehydrogenase family protein [Priestia]|uniref:UDP-glucose 6-dehydrogenase n=1 Tax=Priestia megaterium (strain ATCC 12872 / QMB1551) TaxID=545693 RepID=D5DY69_PRIM1|nr:MULTISPECIES: UDP-glucose/GDP-mannose dehydrogenase family protein [Priestia]MDH6655963.1 UDPglucose 6-dehydrogenase [Bacillus sp. PvP124]ADE68151.1 UDP-glucose 6-dehydrogenase [Priestia megaterium QM B1551]MBG9934175.1 UDP-glucose 6-dehydrogenase [Priestia aryabhattai]MED4091371.1 UDP-glucose/GDP-mannose dehydrogenase family protein [Priestia megaterium]MUL31493.1 UDP-glucose 6-dehydrogenase YwqF [Priestia megaterium]